MDVTNQMEVGDMRFNAEKTKDAFVQQVDQTATVHVQIMSTARMQNVGHHAPMNVRVAARKKNLIAKNQILTVSVLRPVILLVEITSQTIYVYQNSQQLHQSLE